MKVAILGAGNGGQAFAGYLSYKGHSVSLYDRNSEVVSELNKKKRIQLKGVLEIEGDVDLISTKLDKVVFGAEIIMITTTALAHKELAQKLASILVDEQIVVLNPGRTGGAIEFKNTLQKNGNHKHIYVCEAQTLVFACRIKEPGLVNVIGFKNKVLVSAFPSIDNNYVCAKIKTLFECFEMTENVLYTSFENYGAMFHPSIVLFNLASIERNTSFYFYRDLTEKIVDFIDRLDRERIKIGTAYGLKLITASDWIKESYDGVKGDSLLERIKNNPAYYNICSPNTIYARQMLEDLPTGIVPFISFADLAGIDVPIMKSLVSICSQFYSKDFIKEGRNIESLGLYNKSIEDIMEVL